MEPAISKLLTLDYQTRISQVAKALEALGRRFAVVEDRAE